MDSKSKPGRSWQEIEAIFWGTGQLHPSTLQTTSLENFLARVREFDFKKAEALYLSGPLEVSQEIRTLLARGHLEEAEQELAKWAESAPAIVNDPEYLLEEARLHAYNNDWVKALNSTTQALARSPTGITRLTVLQVQALAYFELGLLEKSLVDIEKIEALTKLYPKSISAFYSQVLKVRVLAHSRFQAMARTFLDKLWCEQLGGDFNADKLVVLLRAESELSRCMDLPFDPSVVLATEIVAESIGDRLYAALARAELHLSNARSFELEEAVTQDRQKFKRVDQLIHAVAETNQPATSTARSLYKAHLKNHHFPFVGVERDFKNILFIKFKTIVSFEPFAFKSLKTVTQPFKVVCALAEGPLSKPMLFSKVWGHQKYTAHLHDPLIHQLLFKVRKELGLAVRVNDGLVSLNKALVVKL